MNSGKRWILKIGKFFLSGFVFYRDGAAAPSYLSMIKPFSEDLWIAMGLAILALWATSAVFVCIIKHNAHDVKNFIHGNAAMALISIMTSQGNLYALFQYLR